MMILAIKRRGKYVDLEHVREKISRDAKRKFSVEETSKLLNSLIKRGWLETKAGEYAITDAGREWFEGRWRKIQADLNREYLTVYRAKQYYPHVADTLLEFFRDRYVSVFRLFTGRAWLQRKWGPRYITIKSRADITKHLNIHGIDFIPYIHKIGADRPDWFVIDFDAGKRVPMDKTKAVTKAAYDVLKDLDVESLIKFSGSRGFQIWAQFKPHELPKGYEPLELKTGKRERNFFNFYADLVRFVEAQVAKQLPRLTTAETARKGARVDKVLLDASIIKPMGDVRAPYSIHFKTCLVSMPLRYKELDRFEPLDADPDKVVKRYARRGNEFVLKPVDGSELFNALVEWASG
jgi:DNA primase